MPHRLISIEPRRLLLAITSKAGSHRDSVATNMYSILTEIFAPANICETTSQAAETNPLNAPTAATTNVGRLKVDGGGAGMADQHTPAEHVSAGHMQRFAARV